MRFLKVGLLVSGCFLACSDTHDDASMNAGPDATVDAGHDASSNADHDASSDAGHDAALDADRDGAVCTQTQTMCGDACVDLMADVENCGSCGHACGCGSTSCTAGVCDAHALASGQGAPVVLALHAGALYWGNDIDHNVSTVPVTGGPVKVLYPGRTVVGGIAFDATRIYFSRAVFNIVESGSLDGTNSGNFTNAQEAGASGVATDGTYAYWATAGSGNIRRALLGPPVSPGTTLTSGQAGADGVAVDAASIYWTTKTPSGTIMKMPKSGGAPVVLASSQANPHSIAVDANYVYWTNRGDGTAKSGSVNRVPIGGGAVTTYADLQPSPHTIAIDANYVYWTDSVAGSVMRVPLAGGSPVPVVANEAAPMGLVVTSTCLYFADNADGKAGTGSIRSHDLQ